MRRVAAFDFDGTLTYSDTLIPFMRFCLGDVRFVCAVLKNALWLFLYTVKLYPNWKAKQRLFASCFAGWDVKAFEKAGKHFAERRETLLRPMAKDVLQSFVANGVTVYIVTASMEAWVRPVLIDFPSIKILATCPEVKDGILTGQFASANCYGEEKVRRLLSAESQKENYVLYAFGDSAGDRFLLNLADKPYYRSLRMYEES